MTKDREICEAAEPKRWKANKSGDITSDDEARIALFDRTGDIFSEEPYASTEQPACNARYVAHFDPQYQTLLLDVVDAARKAAKTPSPGNFNALTWAIEALDADGAGEDGG